MKTYTVLAAYIDCDSRAEIRVKANSYKEACEKACEMVDDGSVTTQQESWDPDPMFVYGVVEGKGDPWNGVANVPPEYERAYDFKTVTERAAPLLLASLRNLLAEIQMSEAGLALTSPLAREHAEQAINEAEGR